MKTNVVYMTKTGHTEKLAIAVAKECGTHPINLSNPHVLDDPECLFIGTGIYGGKPNQNLFNYIDQLPVNKIKYAVLFSSSATKKDHSEFLVNSLRAKGIEVFPERFICYGSFMFFKRKRPNSSDIEAVRAFTRRVLENLGEKE